MQASYDIVIVGGGGHAKMLIDALRSKNDARTVAILDADETRKGENVLGVPIIGNDALLAELKTQGTRFFAIGVGGTSNNAPRAALFERALNLGLEPATIVHVAAIVSPAATIGRGAQILPGAIVNPGAHIGDNTIVNSGAIVEHDCVIGSHVHIATGARLASTVHVGDLAHIGAGAVIRQLVTIGGKAVVGAGAAVVKDVAATSVVAGVPAKELSS